MYLVPLLVLYINFKKVFGLIVNRIVIGIPINNEYIMACFIFAFTFFIFLFEYSLDTTGNKACDIANVKKEGSNSNGITYPDIIPYSVVIYLLLYPTDNKIVVKIIGSKKYPILPISFPVVFGIPIYNDSLI